MDSSRRSTAALCLGAFIVALIVWALTTTEGSVRSNDALDYAQMGRQLATGHGFSTLQVFPRHVPFMSEHGLLLGDWPNLHRYPLPTVATALGYLATGDVRQAAALQSGVFYALSVGLFALVCRPFMPLAMAAAATVVFALDPTVSAGAFVGLTEGAASVWVLLILALCTRPSGMTGRDAALAGGVAALAWLTRTQLAILLPIVLVLTAARTRDVRATAWVIAGFSLFAVPWMARCLWLTGDPLFSFSTSRNLVLAAVKTDIDMQLRAPSTTSGVLALYGEPIRHNIWVTQLGRVWRYRRMHDLFAEVPTPLLMVALGVAVAHIRRHTAVVLTAIVLIGCSFIAVSLAFHSSRFYDPLRCLPWLFLAIGAWRLISLRPRILAPVVSLAFSLWWLPFIADGPLAKRIHNAPSTRSDRLAVLADLLPDDAVVASDASARIAAFVERRSVRLPEDPADLLALDALLTVDAVVLTSRVYQDKASDSGLFANYWRYPGFVETDAFLDVFEAGPDLRGRDTLYLRRR